MFCFWALMLVTQPNPRITSALLLLVPGLTSTSQGLGMEKNPSYFGFLVESTTGVLVSS